MTAATQLARRNDDFDELDSQLPAVPVQRVQTNYTTAMAVQRPRELTRVERTSLQEATLIGAHGYYAWGAGKDRIEGPSKDLAMTLVRCWGNCAIDLGEVQDLPDSWIFTATFVDLETGFTLARQFRQSKTWVVYGKFDPARKEDIRFQIGQSKAVRNVILNVLPKWLVSRAMDACKGGVREKIEESINKHGVEKIVAHALDRLEKLGASEARVLEAMGRKARGAITVEDLVIIHGGIAALETGADTLDAIFPLPTVDGNDSGKGGAAALTKKLEAKQPDPAADTQPDPTDEGPPESVADEGAENIDGGDASNDNGPPHYQVLIDLLAGKCDCANDKAEKRLADYAKKVLGVKLADLTDKMVTDTKAKIADGSLKVANT